VNLLLYIKESLVIFPLLSFLETKEAIGDPGCSQLVLNMGKIRRLQRFHQSSFLSALISRNEKRRYSFAIDCWVHRFSLLANYIICVHNTRMQPTNPRHTIYFMGLATHKC